MLLTANKIKPRPKSPCALRASETNGKDVTLTGSVEFDQDSLKAAKDGESPKVPTFKMIANTGKPMKLSGFYDPVIVSIKGARFAKKVTPIIMDHDVSARVGHTTQQDIDAEAGVITVQGQVSASGQAAKEFVADAKAGIPFESSIGATILDSTYVPEGKSMKVNGKEWNGPLIVANKVKIREVTATLLGADGDTETKVAASKGKDMDKELKAFIEGMGLIADDLSEDQVTKIKAQWEKTKNPPKDPPPVRAKEDPDSLEAQRQAERELRAAELDRVERITALAEEYKDRCDPDHEYEFRGKKIKGLKALRAAAVRTDVSADNFELMVMRSSRADRTNQPGLIFKNGDLEAEVIEARIARDLGMAGGKQRWQTDHWNEKEMGRCPDSHKGAREFGMEAYYKPEVLEKSHEQKYAGLHSIKALLDVQIRAGGHYYASYDRNSTQFLAMAVQSYEEIKAAQTSGYTFIRSSGFSTLNVPNILENLMHKFALAAFDAQEQTWRAICGRKNLNDFRPHNMYRLNFDGHFRQVDQQGQLKHISLKDSKYTVQADTFGAMITIDRKTIRNDDLGMIVQKASALGMLGANRIEQSIYVLLLANPGAFFSATLGNLITGASSALNQTGASTPTTPAGLDKARQSFRNQVINGYPISISPRVLLVGTTQEMWANQLWKQENFAVAGVSGSVNWLLNRNEFQGLYRPVVTPYLNNTSLTDDDGNSLSGQSSTQWFLFADPVLPQGSAMVIGFVDGRDQPYFDQADTQFNVPGGIQFRSYLDWGVAMNVFQLALKSAGA